MYDEKGFTAEGVRAKSMRFSKIYGFLKKIFIRMY